MTRDEMITKAMAKATGAGAGDAALLRMASTAFLERLANLADGIDAGSEDSRYATFDEAIACGQLHAHADAMPGITLSLAMSDRTSYQMRSIWSHGTTLPQCLSDGIVGRRVSDVVELPADLPAEIGRARIREVFHSKNRKLGPRTRFDLDQPVRGA